MGDKTRIGLGLIIGAAAFLIVLGFSNMLDLSNWGLISAIVFIVVGICLICDDILVQALGRNKG